MKDSRAQASPVRAKTNVRRQRRSRRPRWSAVIGCIWAFAAIIGVADITAAMLPQRSPDAMAATSAPEARNGVIRQETGSEQCELGTFDNETGRINEDSRHCERTVVLDPSGVPVPLGTIRSLDSIRKSFSSENR